MAKPLGRRRIRNVFGVPPSAVPREPGPSRPKRARRREPPFDIDTVRRKPADRPRPKR